MLWYKGDYDEECGLKYGDEVEIKPNETNDDELDLFGIIVNNKRTGKSIERCVNIEWIVQDFTWWEKDIFTDQIPTKPIKYWTETYCPNCDEKVADGVEECGNCGQVLDWGED